MRAQEATTSPDATGFSGPSNVDQLGYLVAKLDTLEGKLDDIVYALEQIQERLLDINTEGPGYSVTD